MWNSTLSRKTPLRRHKPERNKSIAVVLGFLRPLGHKEPAVLRSEAHRRNVAKLACICCGIEGISQVAHPNFGRGKGQKACDSLAFPLCADQPGRRGCHPKHDSGGMNLAERRKLEWEYADATRAELIARHLWPSHVETAYQVAIVPLARMVHGVTDAE